jgi:uncharacterized metal-binding protein
LLADICHLDTTLTALATAKMRLDITSVVMDLAIAKMRLAKLKSTVIKIIVVRITIIRTTFFRIMGTKI